jgi:hypothetical protein
MSDAMTVHRSQGQTFNTVSFFSLLIKFLWSFTI